MTCTAMTDSTRNCYHSVFVWGLGQSEFSVGNEAYRKKAIAVEPWNDAFFHSESTRAKTNVLNPNESNIPKTNEYSNIL